MSGTTAVSVSESAEYKNQVASASLDAQGASNGSITFSFSASASSDPPYNVLTEKAFARAHADARTENGQFKIIIENSTSGSVSLIIN